jgi:hypothetical protein
MRAQPIEAFGVIKHQIVFSFFFTACSQPCEMGNTAFQSTKQLDWKPSLRAPESPVGQPRFPQSAKAHNQGTGDRTRGGTPP